MKTQFNWLGSLLKPLYYNPADNKLVKNCLQLWGTLRKVHLEDLWSRRRLGATHSSAQGFLLDSSFRDHSWRLLWGYSRTIWDAGGQIRSEQAYRANILLYALLIWLNLTILKNIKLISHDAFLSKECQDVFDSSPSRLDSLWETRAGDEYLKGFCNSVTCMMFMSINKFGRRSPVASLYKRIMLKCQHQHLLLSQFLS